MPKLKNLSKWIIMFFSFSVCFCRFDFSNKTVTIAGVIPAVKLEGEYQFDGKIFSVGFKGKGKRSTTLSK